jgi:hypothetical protein
VVDVSLRKQGFFGPDTGRQVAQLERDTSDGINQASKAYRLKTSRPYEEETVTARADSFYQVDCVSTGRGTVFMMPDPKRTPGATIRIAALGSTDAPFTTFTLVPSAGYSVMGDNEATTMQGDEIRIELTATGTDWALTSRSP